MNRIELLIMVAFPDKEEMAKLFAIKSGEEIYYAHGFAEDNNRCMACKKMIKKKELVVGGGKYGNHKYQTWHLRCYPNQKLIEEKFIEQCEK